MGETGRRTVLALSAGGVAALVGCQVYGPPDQAAPPAAPAPSPVGPGTTGATTGATGGATTAATGGATPEPASDAPEPAVGTPLVEAADVAVGGGVILADQNLVVTQPAQGEFRAFSATCTHQGCQVSDVADGTIICNCHQSRFAITDGSVVAGPAGGPLPETEVVVEGGTVGLP